MEGTSGSSPGDVTRLLLTLEAQTGDPRVVEQLVTILYDHLRSRARGVLHGQAGPMQPTELVHEAFLTLVEQTRVSWRNRAHFLAVAARVMRRILVDHHRAAAAAKRGGGGSG